MHNNPILLIQCVSTSATCLPLPPCFWIWWCYQDFPQSGLLNEQQSQLSLGLPCCLELHSQILVLCHNKIHTSPNWPYPASWHLLPLTFSCAVYVLFDAPMTSLLTSETPFILEKTRTSSHPCHPITTLVNCVTSFLHITCSIPILPAVYFLDPTNSDLKISFPWHALNTSITTTVPTLPPTLPPTHLPTLLTNLPGLPWHQHPICISTQALHYSYLASTSPQAAEMSHTVLSYFDSDNNSSSNQRPPASRQQSCLLLLLPPLPYWKLPWFWNLHHPVQPG